MNSIKMGVFKAGICINLIGILLLSEFGLTQGSPDVTKPDEDFLNLLLQDRKSRLENFGLLTSDEAEINLFHYTVNALSNIEERAKLPKIVKDQYPLFAAAYKEFSNKSPSFRREGYQLIRDLYIEIPSENDNNDCLQPGLETSNRTVDSIHLQDFIFNIGRCFNLTHVSKGGSDNFGNFAELDGSESPVVQRIQRILNGLLILLSNANRDQEFIGGETPWYGKVSEDNFEKWQNLTTYVLICGPAPPLLISENDQLERLLLLEERQMRLATYPYDYFDNDGKNVISVMNEKLRDANVESGNENRFTDINFEGINQQFSAKQKYHLRLEFYQLVRDLVMEVKLISSDKFPEYSKDDCTLDFMKKYVRWIFNKILYDSRDDHFTGQIFARNRIIAEDILNLTYVDYKGNIMKSVDGETKGKYVKEGNSTECPLFRRLRHIINGFEKLYYNMKNTTSNGSLRSEVPPEEYLTKCNYHDVADFFQGNLPFLLKAAEDMIIRNTASIRLGDKLQFLKNLGIGATRRNESVDTVPVDKLDQLPLFAEAHKVFSDWPESMRSTAYSYVEFLYLHQNSDKTEDHVVLNLFGDKTKPEDTCKIDKQCPDQFLRLLQLIGDQLGLKYVNELGEEILIDDTLSGTFIRIPVTKKEDVSVDWPTHHLNSLIKLMRQRALKTDKQEEM